jgi:hypothetical protein
LSTVPPARTFLQRRVLDPILAQLTQGLTPEKIALTIAFGSSLALFPVLGTTTLLCFFAGVALKLNQPILQAVNYACTPLQLAFIPFALVGGDRWLGGGTARFDLNAMLRLFADSPLQFLRDYSLAAACAIALWAVMAPCWAALVYFAVRPLLRGVARSRAAAAAPASSAT